MNKRLCSIGIPIKILTDTGRQIHRAGGFFAVENKRIDTELFGITKNVCPFFVCTCIVNPRV